MNSEGEIKLFAPFPSWENGIESEYHSGWKGSLRSSSRTFNILVLLNDTDKREIALYCHLCGLSASCMHKGQHSDLSCSINCCGGSQQRWETVFGGEMNGKLRILLSFLCLLLEIGGPILECCMLPDGFYSHPPRNLKYLTWVWNPLGGKALTGECKCKIGWKYQWGNSAMELSGTLKMRVL